MDAAREFSVFRHLDAAPGRVWRAFTDADALAAWWGPHGFAAAARLDVREGGAFEIVMRGADGVAYPIEGSYLSVEAPRLLVMEMSLENHPANWRDYLAELFTRAGGAPEELAQVRVVTRVTLTPEAGGTRLDIAQVYESEALRDAFAGMGNAEGWTQSLDKLQRALA